MTNSVFDLMTKVETLDTDELENVLLWIEFIITKRMILSARHEGGTNHE